MKYLLILFFIFLSHSSFSQSYHRPIDGGFLFYSGITTTSLSITIGYGVYQDHINRSYRNPSIANSTNYGVIVLFSGVAIGSFLMVRGITLMKRKSHRFGFSRIEISPTLIALNF